jgi:hypothetical protein
MKFFLLVIIFGILITIFLSCQTFLANKASISEIAKGLQSDNESVREKASKLLDVKSKQKATLEEGKTALREASKRFPKRKLELHSSQTDLINFAATNLSNEYPAIIKECYKKYDSRAKSAALNILASLNNPSTIHDFLDLMSSCNDKDTIDYLPLTPFEKNKAAAKIVFPDLFKFYRNNKFQWPILSLALKYLQDSMLNPNLISQYSDTILMNYQSIKQKLIGFEKPKGLNWIWEDGYLEYREDAGLLLDILGYFISPEISKELQSSIKLPDPKLKMFALLSCLRQNLSYDNSEIVKIAEAPEVRNALYDHLKISGKLELFPKQFANQKYFAESDMVNWLVYPTELGRSPDEIVLAKKVSIEYSDAIVDYYVFKFRTLPPHWAADNGWTAGVAGGYIRSEEPTTQSQGSTFSSFEAFDSKTPEKHVEAITGLIQKANKKWQKNKSQ